MSQDKFPINFDRPRVSSEEIASRRDFAAVLAAVPASKPFYQKGWFLATCGIAALSLLIGSALWWSSTTPEPVEAEVVVAPQPDLPEPPPVRPLINPAFQDIQIQPTTTRVMGSEARTLLYPTGTRVHLPQNAFLDELGYVVSGEVEVSFTEFHDPTDFLISGIPLEYDSGGVHHRFASAGMVQLLAEKDGKPVFTNPEAPIEVQLASTRGNGHYNLYHLDKKKANWVMEGEPRIVKDAIPIMEVEAHRDSTTVGKGNTHTRTVIQDGIMISCGTRSYPIDGPPTEPADPTLAYESRHLGLKDQLAMVIDDIAAHALNLPIEPLPANPEYFNFNIEVDPAEFPELDGFKELRFEIRDPNTRFSAELYEVVWTGAQLSTNLPGKNYQLLLSKGHREEKFIVYPVYDKANGLEVVAIFQNKMEEYQSKMDQLEASKAQLEKDVESSFADLKEEQAKWVALQEELKEKRAKWLEEMKEKEEARRVELMAELKARQNVISDGNLRLSFQVDRFGIWNCDRVINSPKIVAVQPTYQLDGKPFQPGNLHHIDYSENNVTSYYQGNTPLRIDPTGNNVLVVILANQQLAFVSKSQLEKLTAGTAEINFTLVDKPLASLLEVRTYLDEYALK